MPECPPGPRSAAGALGVDEQLAVDGVADLALERSDRLALGLALGNFAFEVRATFGVGLAELADRCHVLLPDILVEDGCVIVGADGRRGQSAVISVMAARAEDSSTMFFLVA